jgi:hypothetical protein
MDAERFDRVVQTLAADGVSRRRVLKGLLAGAGGGAFALLTARSSKAIGCRRHYYQIGCNNYYDCGTKEGRASARDYAVSECY